MDTGQQVSAVLILWRIRIGTVAIATANSTVEIVNTVFGLISTSMAPTGLNGCSLLPVCAEGSPSLFVDPAFALRIWSSVDTRRFSSWHGFLRFCFEQHSRCKCVRDREIVRKK